MVRKAELLHVLGATGQKNVQQEQVQQLDLLSNSIMVALLKASKRAALLVSEEEELAIHISSPDAHYCVVFDPLDGSSNIDCGVSVGTIFGIYRIDPSSATPPVEQIKCPGNKMIAGGYCMYGSSCVFVLAVNSEVNGYTLDPNIGEFLLTHRKMTLGTKKIYSLNEGYAHSFSPAINGYLNSLKFPAPGFVGKFTPYSARYVGSMVADV